MFYDPPKKINVKIQGLDEVHPLLSQSLLELVEICVTIHVLPKLPS